MEMLQQEPTKTHMTYHCNSTNSLSAIYTGTELADGAYHSFSVEWAPSALVIYVDHVDRFRVTECIPNQAMYLLANLAIGGWPGPPDNTTPFPAYMDIDYIRAYSYVASGGVSLPGPGAGIPYSNPYHADQASRNTSDSSSWVNHSDHSNDWRGRSRNNQWELRTHSLQCVC